MEEPNENSPLERRVQSDDPTLSSRASAANYTTSGAGNIKTDITRLTDWTVGELLNAKFPDPEWVLPGILPEGFAVLGGRPKIGKSFWGLELALAKSTGGMFLGKEISPGRVVYLALEDRPRRVKERLIALHASDKADIRFEFENRDLEKGGFKQLELLISSYHPGLIVIDTLSRVLGDADQTEIGRMSSVFGRLHSISRDFGVSILGLDHHRKTVGSPFNPIDDLLGSTGKSAPLDTVLGLYRERGAHDAKLIVLGRDVDDQEIFLVWDPGSFTWNIKGAFGLETSRKKTIYQAVVKLIAEGKLATITNIAGITSIDRVNVAHELNNLLNQGVVAKGKKVGRQQPYCLSENVINLMNGQT